MSIYKVTPKKCYNHFGVSYNIFNVYIKKSFFFVSWWSPLTTCRYISEAETLINNLNKINDTLENQPQL